MLYNKVVNNMSNVLITCYVITIQKMLYNKVVYNMSNVLNNMLYGMFFSCLKINVSQYITF